MSKQQDEVTRLLMLLYPDLKSEVTLDKITGVITHRCIRVDIYVPSIRLVLEIHGIQHHKPSGFGKNKIETHLTFMEQQARDSRLKDICDKFDINYEQIDYDEKVNLSFLYKKFEKYAEEN